MNLVGAVEQRNDTLHAHVRQPDSNVVGLDNPVASPSDCRRTTQCSEATGPLPLRPTPRVVPDQDR
jgi:hypothetical protein